MGVEGADGERRRVGFDLAEPVGGVDDLALEIGYFDPVGVGYADRSDSGGGEVGEHGRAESPASHDENAGGLDAGDPGFADTFDEGRGTVSFIYHGHFFQDVATLGGSERGG